jgi:hypothetical protein
MLLESQRFGEERTEHLPLICHLSNDGARDRD